MTELLVLVRIIGRPDADTFAIAPMVARSGVRAIGRAIGTACCSLAIALIAVDVLVTHTLDPHHILVLDFSFVLRIENLEALAPTPSGRSAGYSALGDAVWTAL